MKLPFPLYCTCLILLALFADRGTSEEAKLKEEKPALCCGRVAVPEAKPADAKPQPKPTDAKPTEAKPALCCGRTASDGSPMRSVLISSAVDDKPKTKEENPPPKTKGERLPPKGEKPVVPGEKPVVPGEKPLPRPEKPIPRPEKPVPMPEKPIPRPEKPIPRPMKPIPENPIPMKEGPLDKPEAGCKHEITFQNLNSASTATQIRVTPYSGGAVIQSAYGPNGWTTTTSPTQVLFKKGAVIPVGTYPGFVIKIASNNQGQQWLLVEWLDANGETICGQPLFFPCSLVKGEPKALAAPAGAPKYNGPACGCLNAYTGGDESGDIEDADIEITDFQVSNAGFLQCKVDYSLSLQPGNLPITRTWQVLTLDENENPVIVAAVVNSDNYNAATGMGIAMITFPVPGDYEVNLHVKSSLACLNDPEGVRDTVEDDESGDISTVDTPPSLTVTASDPCKWWVYKLTNTTTTPPVGGTPVWTVDGDTVTPDGSGNYAFDQSHPEGKTYQVCLAYSVNGMTLPGTCLPVTPKKEEATINFSWKYNSCSVKDFVVSFQDLTKNASGCPLEYKWDFGDGSPVTSANKMQNPMHTYAAAGTYTVSLTISGVANPVKKDVTIAHWEPKMEAHVCGDGTILWTTNDGTIFNVNDHTFGRTWNPSEGHASIFRRHFKKLRVCYDDVGVKNMSLTATNELGGECTAKGSAELTAIVHCCRRDRAHQIGEVLQVNGKNYRMKAVFKYRGVIGRIDGKTKLQVEKYPNVWVRTKADSISVSYSGNVVQKGDKGYCRCESPYVINLTTKTHSNKASVSKWKLPGIGTFRVMKDGLTSSHNATIKGQVMTPIELKLWSHDCGCSWKN